MPGVNDILSYKKRLGRYPVLYARHNTPSLRLGRRCRPQPNRSPHKTGTSYTISRAVDKIDNWRDAQDRYNRWYANVPIWGEEFDRQVLNLAILCGICSHRLGIAAGAQCRAK